MQNYSSGELINVGTGVSISLAELALKIAKRVGFSGKVEWDHSKPDGTPHRRLDCSKIFELGWKPTTSLDDGIQQAYEDFLTRVGQD
jgi:GDP-L-fucose synthase